MVSSLKSARSWRSALGIAALLGLVGCDRRSGTPITPEPPPYIDFEECGPALTFHRDNFPNPSVIDSPWFPLVPGTQMIYDGEANPGSGIRPHRVVLTVTDLTKVIQGVRCVVVWDRDYNNGELLEAELAFFAQDKDKSVWTMGEYPEEYQNGQFLGAPSTWISGISNAEAGILVPGNPRVGVKFLQGFAPDVNFLDCAMVYRTGESTCVPFNCYENVLVIEEGSPLDVGSGHQLKFYAGGVGNVNITPVNDPEGETLVLTNVLHLNAQAMAEARAAALRLEERAYQVNNDYRRTQPAE